MGPVAQPVFKTGEVVQPTAGSVRLRRRSVTRSALGGEQRHDDSRSQHGEMRELGSLSEEAHRRVGKRAAEVFDAVAVVDGERARPMAEAAGAEVVPDRAAALAWVRGHASPGDRVLVKASHGVRLDELVKELTAV